MEKFVFLPTFRMGITEELCACDKDAHSSMPDKIYANILRAFLGVMAARNRSWLKATGDSPVVA